MTVSRLIVCVLALIVAGCSNDNTQSPTTPTTTATSETPFSAALTVGGTVTTPFTVVATGTATLNLTSVTLTPTGPATTTQLGIGVGPATVDADGNTICGAVTNSATVAPALTAQLSAPVVSGSYCASVFDPGTLNASVIFFLRIIHP